MTELERYTACTVCGSKEYSILATQEQLDAEILFAEKVYRRGLKQDTPEHMLDDLTVFTNDYPARLVECQPCGLVSRDPRFSQTGSIAAYAQDTYHLDWLETTFQQYHASFRSQMPQLVKMVGCRANVLEVGSYVGGFLAAARDYGWQAQGIDVGRQVSEFVRSKGLKVITGTLLDADLPDQAFDAVFVWVCFDQMPDPWATLSEIWRVLVPNGWLVLQVPNGDFAKLVEPMARKTMGHRVGDSLLKTLTYTGIAGFRYQIGYTPASLKRLLRESGFGRIDVRNHINVADADECRKYEIPEQGIYVSRVQAASNALAVVSFGRAIMGPWIRSICRKG